MADFTDVHEDLARVVVVDRDLNDVLSEITRIARRAVPGPDAASITLIRGEKRSPPPTKARWPWTRMSCSTSGVTGRGLTLAWPGRCCGSTIRQARRGGPTTPDTRPPMGVSSSLSVPLPFQSVTIGALNTYAGRSHALTEEDQVLAEELGLALASSTEWWWLPPRVTGEAAQD